MSRAETVGKVLDDVFAGRWFQVYAIASGESLSKPMSFSKASDEMETFGHANGASNGMDLREVK